MSRIVTININGKYHKNCIKKILLPMICKCWCGCGNWTAANKVYIHGHNGKRFFYKVLAMSRNRSITQEEIRKRVATRQERGNYAHSEITKQKISTAKKGQRPSDEAIRKITDTLTGRKLSIEHRAKLATNKLLYYENDENRKKTGDAIRRSRSENPLINKIISQKRIAYLENNPNAHPYNIIRQRGESSLEKLFRLFLESFNLRKDMHFFCNYRVGRYLLDFAFPTINFYVEIDGPYHNSGKAIARDRNRDVFLLEKGWEGLRIPVSCLKYVLNIFDRETINKFLSRRQFESRM